VLVDINPDDYNMSLEDTVSKITDRTKAIILPHMFGKPVKNISDFLANPRDIPVIEDCALSVGASHDGKKVGSFGRLSIFSFRATKMMAAGLGGAVLTDDKDLKVRLDDLVAYDNRVFGGESYNYQMCDINAALALSQLRKLDGFVAARRNVASKYTEMFKRSNVDFEFPEANGENVFLRYIIRHPNSEEFIENVNSRGVDVARPVFLPLHRYLNIPNDKFPNVTRAYSTAVSIPIYPTMDPLYDNKSVVYVAGTLVNWRHEK
jgi:dTDP-4-amino-4,6-dideoxygalactose transaminase